MAEFGLVWSTARLLEACAPPETKKDFLFHLRPILEHAPARDRHEVCTLQEGSRHEVYTLRQRRIYLDTCVPQSALISCVVFGRSARGVSFHPRRLVLERCVPARGRQPARRLERRCPRASHPIDQDAASHLVAWIVCIPRCEWGRSIDARARFCARRGRNRHPPDRGLRTCFGVSIFSARVLTSSCRVFVCVPFCVRFARAFQSIAGGARVVQGSFHTRPQQGTLQGSRQRSRVRPAAGAWRLPSREGFR